MNDFFLVIACRNAESYITKCIDSILDQTHTNWTAVVVSDASTDRTYEVAIKASRGDPRIKVIKNSERKYALRNIVETIWTYAPHDSIVTTVDGDDRLSDINALKAVSDEYDKTGCDALWTSYEASDGSKPISMPMGGNPLVCPWCMSHMRTFRCHLIRTIPPHLFINPRYGIWWRWSYDQILYRPILHVAKKVVFFPRVCYYYNVPEKNYDYIDVQRMNALDIINVLPHEYVAPADVVFIVGGPNQSSDKRFHMGERRAPLGIMSMASYLKTRGHKVSVIDRFVHPNMKLEIDGGFVGVYCNTPNISDSTEIIKTLKARNDCFIVAGGPHAILHPSDVLNMGAHCVCTGEADFAISDIVNKRPRDIYDPRPVDNMDSLPIPMFDVLQMGEYDYSWDYSPSMPIFPMTSSRGCPRICSFCQTRDVMGTSYRAMSAERTMNDVLWVQKKYNAKGIYFREDNFGHDEDRLAKFCKLINGRIEWACEVRTDISPDLIPLMARNGCVGAYLGIEAATDRMLLDVFHKGINTEDITRSIKLLKKNKIKMALSFIEKHPLETQNDINAREALIKKYGPEVVHRCAWRPRGINV